MHKGVGGCMRMFPLQWVFYSMPTAREEDRVTSVLMSVFLIKMKQNVFRLIILFDSITGILKQTASGIDWFCWPFESQIAAEAHRINRRRWQDQEVAHAVLSVTFMIEGEILPARLKGQAGVPYSWIKSVE